MCGRYTLTASAQDILNYFEVADTIELRPRYNVAPTQSVPVVVHAEGVRRLRAMRWGLIPSWAKDPAIGARMINARGETLAEKPSFRVAYRQRRCLLPCDGFYEWKAVAGRKWPYRIGMADGGLFALAGLWEHWRSPDGESIESCTIVTTAANDLITELHDRMPVIVGPESHQAWLGGTTEQAAPLIRAFPADRMCYAPANPILNNARVDSASCVLAPPSVPEH